MYRILQICIIALLIPLSVNAASYDAAFSVESRQNDEEITTAFGLQGWFSQATAKWQISFPYTTQFVNPGIGPGTTGRIESRLEYKKIDSPIAIAAASARVTPLISLDVIYGTGSISGGAGVDTDHFTSSNSNLEFAQSTSSLDGTVRLWGLDLALNGKRFADPHSGNWGMVLGFFHYGDNIRMKSGIQTVSVTFDGIAFPSTGPFPSTQVLNATYNFSWDMIKTGVEHHAELTDGLSYALSLSYYPYVDYQGDGYWNLRAGTGPMDFRMQSPNFVHKSTKGYGYEGQIEVGYETSKNLALLAGYRYLYLYAGNGTDTTYFADGSALVSTLDWATVTRQGFYAELLLKF